MLINHKMTDESKVKALRNKGSFLIVNGKNLFQRRSNLSQSRVYFSTSDKGVRIDIPKQNSRCIQDFLSRNISGSNWSLNVESKPQITSLLYLEKPEDSPRALNMSQSCLFPAVKEVDLRSRLKLIKKIKTKSVVVKYKLNPIEHYKHCLAALQLANGFEIAKPQKINRYYVGSGNNDQLVKKILHKKQSWMQVNSIESAQFIWTQTRKKKIFNLLPEGTNQGKKDVKISSLSFSLFEEDLLTELSPVTSIDSAKIQIYSKLERNQELSNKKRLFVNLKKYYTLMKKNPFEHIPLTFHISKGIKDGTFAKFKEEFLRIQAETNKKADKYLNNIWLVKPGEFTNRGSGISICSSLSEITRIIEEAKFEGSHRTYIIQKYIYRPLLYKGRKFDIRCYVLVTAYNSNLQAYFYREGYLRTAVAEFSLENMTNKFIHLTNDAIQKRSVDYGKFEESNKLSYEEFQDYLDADFEKNADVDVGCGTKKKVNFVNEVMPKIKVLVRDSIAATHRKLDPNNRQQTFEIFGYDFMVDEFFHPWLIEVNTNPCLELSGSYLSVLIPGMLKDAFHIALDQFFVNDHTNFEENKFSLIFDQARYVLERSKINNN